MKALGADLAAAGRAVGDEVAAVAALGEVPEEIQAIAADTRDYASGMWDTTFRWVRAVLIVIVVSLGILILGRLSTFLQELQTGWILLRHGGRFEAVAGFGDLEARVRKLERSKPTTW